eukprot:gene18980-6322_t
MLRRMEALVHRVDRNFHTHTAAMTPALHLKSAPNIRLPVVIFSRYSEFTPSR